jgi:bisphosphoglycerate-independent phosphoglycerate mutase (AlkP superfamily)
MHNADDLLSGDAMSEEWTGNAWREFLGYPDAPLYTPEVAGRKMVELSRRLDFAFFSHWYTDIIGHRGPMPDAISLLETIDGVMRGALDAWDDDEGLMILTSDHGNFEALDHGKHTENKVPTIVIGKRRREFADGFEDLTQITPNILKILGVK